MAATVLPPKTIWRGNPVSANHTPDPVQIVAYLESLEAGTAGTYEAIAAEADRAQTREDEIDALVPRDTGDLPEVTDKRYVTDSQQAVLAGAAFSVGLVYNTKAALDADLVPAANTRAEVRSDSTASNNGVYRKVGATTTGSWAYEGPINPIIDLEFRDLFPPSMHSGKYLFSGASGNPTSVGPPDADFVFSNSSTKGPICTLTLTASEAKNMTFRGYFPVAPGAAYDVAISYELISGSLTTLGCAFWKIDPSTYNQGGGAQQTKAESTTGVRKTFRARWTEDGGTPSAVTWPAPGAWTSGTVMARPGATFTAGGSGAVIVIHSITVDRVTAAENSRTGTAVALPASLEKGASQMHLYAAKYFCSAASGSEESVADATYPVVADGALGPCLQLVGPTDTQLNRKGLVPATPGRTYEVEIDCIVVSGEAEIKATCWRLPSSFSQSGSASYSFGTKTSSDGRLVLIARFRDTAAGSIVAWSPGGETAVFLRVGLTLVHAGGDPATVNVKSIRITDVVASDGTEDLAQAVIDAETARDEAEIAAAAVVGFMFAGNNSYFGAGTDGSIGWHSAAWSGLTYQSAGIYAAALNGATMQAAVANSIGGICMQVPAGAFVTWRQVRAVDPAESYALRGRAKAVSSTRDVSFGLLCYDVAGNFLDARWFAADTETLTTSFSEFTGVISGEGAAEDQFPAGTTTVREVFYNLSAGTVDLDILRFTYSG